MSIEPNRLSAADAARRIAGGQLKSEALVASCLEHIAAREPEVQAWEFLDPELALKQARALAWEHQHHAGQLSESLRPRIEEGWALPREAYDAARLTARDCRRRLAERMRECDFLLTPGATGEAPATLATTGSSVFNRVWTLLGVPCVTLPFGAGPNGLPLGVQLVGAFDGDSELLGWSHWTAGVLAG